MFAIVKLGNQQFKVKAGDFIRVPYQKVSPGEEIEAPVLGFGEEDEFVFSAEELKKSKVKAILLRQSLSKKSLVFKKKKRKGYRRTKGHRQKISEFKVLELCSPAGKTSKVEFKKPASKKANEKKEDNKPKSVKFLKAGVKKSSKSSEYKNKKVKNVKTKEEKVKELSKVKFHQTRSNQTKSKKTSHFKAGEKKAGGLKSKDKKISEEKPVKFSVTEKSNPKK